MRSSTETSGAGRGGRWPSLPAVLARVVLGGACSVFVLGAAAAQPLSPGAVQDRRVEMVEFAFRPTVIVLESGRPVRLRFTNRGQIAHQFESAYLKNVPVLIASPSLHVEAPGLDVLRVAPGGEARLEFLPRRRGRFRFACTIEGHQEAGMRGVLEVR